MSVYPRVVAIPLRGDEDLRAERRRPAIAAAVLRSLLGEMMTPKLKSQAKAGIQVPKRSGFAANLPR